jgi:hypothetical protein
VRSKDHELCPFACDYSRALGPVVLLARAKEIYDESSMTTDERRIANAALGAGPWANHDQIVIAVADGLKLEAKHVEAVLQRLRIRMVLVCVSAARAGSESAASVRYEKGMDWTEE